MTEIERLIAAEARVIAWAEAKGIFAESTPDDQLDKTLEELRELLAAIKSGDAEQIKLELGDVLVTRVIRARMGGGSMGWQDRDVYSTPLYSRDAFFEDSICNETSLCGQTFAKSHGFTFADALEAAVAKIEKRKGAMIDGKFVKEGA